jgi:predicted permease
MSLKQLALIISGATLIFWLCFAFILFEVDPFTSGVTGIAVFYACLFFALLGTFFVPIILLRRKLDKEELEYHIVKGAIRQSLFFSFTIVIVLFLQSKRFLTWWNLLFLVLLVTMVEYLFLSVKKKLPSHEDDILQPPAGYLPPDF